MRTLLVLLFSVGLLTNVLAQKSYIQVSGEPDLSVYLNNQSKGITTAEFKGLIIENVNPGTHTIKIVKQGYTPFEENITVRAGEVFAYKVKPFVKHAVTISEYGNSGEVGKQVEARTGKLVVQSVPIEIKITIPNIEGVKNIPKTKDEWVVNDIQVGRYEIEMSFGSKTLKKQITVTENDVTNVFVNMVSGEFNATTAMSPAKIKAKNEAYFKYVLDKYSIKRASTPATFYAQTPSSAAIAQYKDRDNSVWISVPDKAILKTPSLTPGPRFLSYDRKSVHGYYYALKGFDDYNAALQFYNAEVSEFKNNIDANYLYTSTSNPLDVSFDTNVDGQRTVIGYQLKQVGKGAHWDVIIRFGLY